MKQNYIWITGAAGFIGKNLALRLAKNGELIFCPLMKNSNLEISHGNIHAAEISDHYKNLKELAELYPPRVIFHLASCFLVDHKDGDEFPLIDSNVMFGTALLQMASGLSDKPDFINTSTAWVHENGCEYRPVNLYAATKEAFSDILTYYVNVKSIRAITLELNDTYGEGDPRRKIVKLLLDAAFTKTTIDVSPGEQYLDVVHVEDIVSAFIKGWEYLQHNSESNNYRFAILSSAALPLKEIGAIIEEFTQTQNLFLWGKRAYRPNEIMKPYQFSPTLPNWKPEITLKEGLQRVWSFLTKESAR